MIQIFMDWLRFQVFLPPDVSKAACYQILYGFVATQLILVNQTIFLRSITSFAMKKSFLFLAATILRIWNSWKHMFCPIKYTHLRICIIKHGTMWKELLVSGIQTNNFFI